MAVRVSILWAEELGVDYTAHAIESPPTQQFAPISA